MQEHYTTTGNAMTGMSGLSFWSVRTVAKSLPNYGPLPDPWPTIPASWTFETPWYLQNGFKCCHSSSCQEKFLTPYTAITGKGTARLPTTPNTPSQAFLSGVTACQQNLPSS